MKKIIIVILCITLILSMTVSINAADYYNTLPVNTISFSYNRSVCNDKLLKIFQYELPMVGQLMTNQDSFVYIDSYFVPSQHSTTIDTNNNFVFQPEKMAVVTNSYTFYPNCHYTIYYDVEFTALSGSKYISVFPNSFNIDCPTVPLLNIRYGNRNNDYLYVSFDTPVDTDVNSNLGWNDSIIASFGFDYTMYKYDTLSVGYSDPQVYRTEHYSDNTYLRNIQMYVDTVENKLGTTIDYLSTINTTIKSTINDYVVPKLSTTIDTLTTEVTFLRSQLNDYLVPKLNSIITNTSKLNNINTTLTNFYNTAAQRIIDGNIYLCDIKTNVGYLKDLLWKSGSNSSDLYNAITDISGYLEPTGSLGIVIASIGSITNDVKTNTNTIIGQLSPAGIIGSKINEIKNNLENIYTTISNFTGTTVNVENGEIMINTDELEMKLDENIETLNNLVRGYNDINGIKEAVNIGADEFTLTSSEMRFAQTDNLTVTSGQKTLLFDFKVNEPYAESIIKDAKYGIKIFFNDSTIEFYTARKKYETTGSCIYNIEKESEIKSIEICIPYTSQSGDYNANISDYINKFPANMLMPSVTFSNFRVYEGAGLTEGYLKGVQMYLADITKALNNTKDSIVNNEIITDFTETKNDILENMGEVKSLLTFIKTFKIPGQENVKYSDMFEIFRGTPCDQ